MSNLKGKREIAIHLRRMGHTTREVAEALGFSEPWVRKWWRAYQGKDWPGVVAASRAPHQHGREISSLVRQAVIKARSALEAEANRGQGLKYIGGRAIRTRLKAKQVNPLPSMSTIERILREAGMTRPKTKEPKIVYPRLRPNQPHLLTQVDHMPHFLTGGERVFCFNALDVVSRYAGGQVYERRRAIDAADFLIYLWQEIGISTYTQVDNEACFSGGFTHAYVLGQCVRLALQVGTELLFSPVRHPQSNGFVERFHQDYQTHVWQDTYLSDSQAVQKQADHFFGLYRQSDHHSALQGQTPETLHHLQSPRRLATTFTRPTEKLPVYAGRIHFIRRVQPNVTKK